MYRQTHELTNVDRQRK